VNRLHHVTVEVDRGKIAEEKLLWGLLGYGETNALARNRPKIHWLINLEEGMAVHLHPTDRTPAEYGLFHLAFVVTDFDRTVRQLESFDFPVEEAMDWHGPRRYVRAPSGYYVELLSASPSIVAGMPTEGES